MAVHFDFHLGNMLAHDDTIIGVIDWDGAGRGDRRLDPVTLRFGVHRTRADPQVAERIDTLLDTITDTVLAPMWAYTSLRMVDWAIPTELSNTLQRSLTSVDTPCHHEGDIVRFLITNLRRFFGGQRRSNMIVGDGRHERVVSERLGKSTQSAPSTRRQWVAPTWERLDTPMEVTMYAGRR
ncbi:MAG: phosphotransferase [Pseudonocardiaceae bacterium]